VTELKGVLGGAGLLEKAREAAQDAGEAELEQLFHSMAKRGRQPNMSCFAFTASRSTRPRKILYVSILVPYMGTKV